MPKSTPEARQIALAELAHKAEGLAQYKQSLRVEYSQLSDRVPTLTLSSVNGGGQAAREELKNLNWRLREIESEQESITEAEAELDAQTRKLNKEAEAERIAILEAEDAQLESEEEEIVESFKTLILSAASELSSLGSLHNRRCEIASDLNTQSPRWRALSRELENYIAWRLGYRSGGRYTLEISSAGPSSTWIAEQQAREPVAEAA